MSAPLQLLVVDDVEHFALAIDSYLRKGAGRLGQSVDVISAVGLDDVEELLEDDVPIDVALVDLGLGAGRPSGLGVIRLLHEQRPGVPIAVHADLSENGSRLLLTFAAFRWFGDDVAALLPKAGDGGDMVTFYADAVAALRDRTPVANDWARTFRRPATGTDWFKELINTPADLQNLQLFARYEKWDEMAAASGKKVSTLKSWTDGKVEAIAALIENVKGTPLQVDQAVTGHDWETNPTTGRASRNTSVLSTLTSFARSQSWFLQDPAVAAIIARPPAR